MPVVKYGLDYHRHLLIAAYGGTPPEQDRARRRLGLRSSGRGWIATLLYPDPHVPPTTGGN